jgi:hypothetical protein
MRGFTPCGATAIRRTSTLLSLSAIAAAGLTLLAPGAARADTAPPVYQSTPLVMSGDRIGTTTIPATNDLYVGGLTDAGQITFSAGRPNGSGPNLLLQWGGGTSTAIVMPASGPASAWPGPVYWPQDVTIDRPISVNQQGSAVFSVSHSNGTGPWGTFLWDAATQSIVPVALKEMPATGNLVFTQPGGVAPAINNRGEIVLVAQVKDSAGLGGFGLFSLGPDRALRPVFLPQQELPVGASGQVRASTSEFFMPSIDDRGRIAFQVQSHTSSRYSSYVWEYGQIDSILTAGAKVPGGGKVTGVSSVSLNNKDFGALVTATTDKGDSSHWGLYRVLGGKITTVAAPGSTMPGGGIFKTIQYLATEENSPPLMAVSSANAAGQHAFLATLEDGTAGAYAVDAAGQLSLLFKAIAQPKPVTIQEVGYSMTFVPGSRPCLNNKGQVALSVRVNGGRSMIMMLTPTQP